MLKDKNLKSQNMDAIDVNQWGLPTNYPTIVEITSENFEEQVLKVKDAWIIVVYKEKVARKWIQHAEHVKGNVWYGAINFDTEKEILQQWGPSIKASDIKFGTSLVFPFGVAAKKKMLEESPARWPQIAAQPQEALALVASSVPNRLKSFDFRPHTMEKFNKWILDAYYHQEKNSKFPILCIAEEPYPAVPLPCLMAATYFDNFFSFGIVHQENLWRMQSNFKELPEIETKPSLMILLGSEPTPEEFQAGSTTMSFDLLPFLEKKYGDPNQFSSFIKFLLTANEDYRKVLLGKRADESEAIQTMASVRKALTKRHSKVTQNVEYQLPVSKDEL